MAEPRRVSLISTALNSDKKPPNREASKHEAAEKDTTFKCVFIDVEEPTEELCPFYDFAKLLEAGKAAEDTKDNSSDDPFGDQQEEAKLAKLAKHFEEKYGPSGPRDLRELGAGYDQNDPFVDDSESAEAMIPSGWTTQHGGYYISTGPLYIRQLKPAEADTHVFKSISTEECLSACKSLNALSLKRKVREESSSEYDSEEETGKAIARRVKRPSMDVSKKSVPLGEGAQKKSNSRTVASILAEKAEIGERPAKIVSSATSADQPSDLRKPKEPSSAALKPRDPDTGMRKAVLAKMERDFRSEPDNVMVPLPDEVDGSLKDIITQLKRAASTWEGGKCNFFTPEHNPTINSVLLELEYECRQLRCGLRSAVFSHLAGHLPCTKETLTKRARKLRQDDVEGRLKEVLKRIERAVHDEPAVEGNMSLSKNLKKLIVDAVIIKAMVYDLHKVRFPTYEDYVRNFVDIELLPLWKDRAVEKQSVYAQAFIGLSEALRPRPKSNRLKTLSEEKEIPIGSSDKTASVRRPTQASPPDSKPLLSDRPSSVSHRTTIPKLHYSKEESDERKTMGHSKEVPSAAHTSSFTSLIPDRLRANDAPAPFTPLPRPRSREDSERRRENEKSQSDRNTPNQAQNLSRSSTPSTSSARPPSKGSADATASSAKQFVQPSKIAKIYQEPRSSKKHTSEMKSLDSGGKSTIRVSSGTSGGAVKKHEEAGQSATTAKSARSSSSGSDPRNLPHSTDAILAPREESKKHGTIVKVSSRHNKTSREKTNAGASSAYNSTTFPVGSIASPYSAFTSIPLMVGFSPENMLGWGAQYGTVFPESFQPPMGLIPGAGSAFNGVGSSFVSRPNATPKNSNSPRTPFHSGDSAFGRHS
ncbi:ubinuclein-1-like [Paramacrobiotus metropolitanus]|uniref:ubinuclein-1-like n=1 Tax=Paramacrobiotus metropolitanus TaxID=2943436 RepID=UPI0024457E53|nr:ubinuclein-1-like [Paramacrobiotus metropolitanus]